MKFAFDCTLLDNVALIWLSNVGQPSGGQCLYYSCVEEIKLNSFGRFTFSINVFSFRTFLNGNRLHCVETSVFFGKFKNNNNNKKFGIFRISSRGN